MTVDTVLYLCNTVAVGLFGIVLSAAFCNSGGPGGTSAA